MKKIFTISFIVLYGLLAVEASFSLHKCMGELKSITIGTEDKVCCCGDNNADDCCGNEQVAFEDGQSEEVLTSFSYQFENNLFTIVELPSRKIITKSKSKLLKAYLDLPPPLEEALYKINCSYIVYG